MIRLHHRHRKIRRTRDKLSDIDGLHTSSGGSRISHRRPAFERGANLLFDQLPPQLHENEEMLAQRGVHPSPLRSATDIGLGLETKWSGRPEPIADENSKYCKILENTKRECKLGTDGRTDRQDVAFCMYSIDDERCNFSNRHGKPSCILHVLSCTYSPDISVLYADAAEVSLFVFLGRFSADCLHLTVFCRLSLWQPVTRKNTKMGHIRFTLCWFNLLQNFSIIGTN